MVREFCLWMSQEMGYLFYSLGLMLQALSLSSFSFELCYFLIGESETKQEEKVTILDDNDHGKLYLTKFWAQHKGSLKVWPKSSELIPSNKMNAVTGFKVWIIVLVTEPKFGCTLNFSLASQHEWMLKSFPHILKWLHFSVQSNSTPPKST